MRENVCECGGRYVLASGCLSLSLSLYRAIVVNISTFEGVCV